MHVPRFAGKGAPFGPYELLILKIAWLRIAQRRACSSGEDYWKTRSQTLLQTLLHEAEQSSCEIAPIRWALDLFLNVNAHECDVSIIIHQN